MRRACTACHQGKTRCSETLPCQSCVKRGLQAQCTYPDPDAIEHTPPPGPLPPQPGHAGLSTLVSFLPITSAEPPPPPPKPPAPKKSKKMLELEEKWEMELEDEVEGWLSLKDAERARLRRAKRDAYYGFDD